MTQTVVNAWLVGSAALVIGLAVFHSLLGEIFLVRRLLRRKDLPTLFGGDGFTKMTIRYAWHLLTLAFVGLGAVLMWAAQPGASTTELDAARIVAVIMALSGAWGLVATRGRHLSWVVLLAAAALAGYGSTM